ncbi:MAG: hypothetical protein COB15_01170 [Flavobacteriales bacterium]|nr:MAG: hypothetical protein COB15_01170 [Flavobacteriales bacterium]
MKSLLYYSITLSAIFSMSHTVKSQNLFDINTIRKIEINFYDSNWDHLLDSLASITSTTGSGTGRILANVIIDGDLLDSCGVRYKGNSSLDTASNKNPFNIDINYTIPGQSYLGKDKIKLANCYSDPSMIREALTYEIANQYMDCPQASFVTLYINNNCIGIYTNTESIDNEYLDQFYGSSSNPFFKCDPESIQIFNGQNSNLAYHSDSLDYDVFYDRKSAYGLTDLQTLCFNLENNPNTIDQYLDVDRALWFLALSSAFVHNDGYTAFAHNFYIYKMDNGRWSIMLWDVNMSFGGLVFDGDSFGLLNSNDLATQDPFIHESAMTYRPLIAQLLSIPRYKKMYVAHYRTIFDENISNNNYYTRAQFMHNLIDADVQNELYSSYTYADFLSNLTNDYGANFNLRPGLKDLMDNRTIYLNSLPEFQYTQPIISNILNNPIIPNAYDTVNFTCNITNSNYAYLGYRYSSRVVFQKVQLLDDGNSNDGIAGDGTYGAQIILNASDIEYYIYAEDNDISTFSPVRAEYEFYKLAVTPNLVINELSASNATIQSDQDGEFDDWIELYNNTSSSIQLDGYYLSDQNSNPTKWTFPTGTNINPNDYLIIWIDKDTLQSGLHTNFKLSSSGETVYLSDTSGTLVDKTTFGLQTTDITWGRYPNGTGSFTTMVPTFSAANVNWPISVKENIVKSSFNIYPNPATNIVNIEFKNNANEVIYIYNLIGELIYQTIPTDKEVIINVSNWTSGVYIIKTQLGVQKLIVT